MNPRSPPFSTSTARSPSRVLFTGTTLCAGHFAIAPGEPNFADAGQMLHPELVFPRTGVWIEHAEARPFVADPTLVTLYNPGEVYRRRALSPEGDRCDWYRFAPEVLLDVLAAVDPAILERPERPFHFPFVKIDARSYLQQNQVALHLRRVERRHADGIDPVYVEEEMLAVLARMVASAGRRSRPSAESGRLLADEVKAFVLPRLGERLTLDRLAATVGCSPFHLCRRFKAETGGTVHAWLSQARLRAALERVAEPGGDLAAAALDLGFASHSHFTSAFRGAFALSPSEYRRQARRGAAAV